MLYIFALHPLSVFAIWRMVRRDLPACRVPCQSPERSPFAWVSWAGAGVAAAVDGEVWALAGLGEMLDPTSVRNANADIARNTDFAVICCSVF